MVNERWPTEVTSNTYFRWPTEVTSNTYTPGVMPLAYKSPFLFSSTVVETLERARGTAARRMGRKDEKIKGPFLFSSFPILRAAVYLAHSNLARSSLSITKALAKRYSQLKPTRAKLQNQNLHRRVA